MTTSQQSKMNVILKIPKKIDRDKGLLINQKL